MNKDYYTIYTISDLVDLRRKIVRDSFYRVNNDFFRMELEDIDRAIDWQREQLRGDLCQV